MTSKIIPLGEIASIRTIMTFRDKAPRYSDEGNAYVITIKDILSEDSFDFTKLPLAVVDDTDLSNQLRPGEILIPGRGEYYQARNFQQLPLPAFPVGQINVIRTKSDLDGGYLTWYLNQGEAQQYIRFSLGGTGVKALSKTRLSSMPVPIPPLSVQREISSLQLLRSNRAALLRELMVIEDREINASCLRLLAME